MAEDEETLLVICPNCLRAHEYPASQKDIPLKDRFPGNKIFQACLQGTCIGLFGYDM